MPREVQAHAAFPFAVKLRKRTQSKQQHMRNEITGNDSSFLKTLAKHIAAQLEGRPFCVVFEDDLKRCWPSKQMSQEERNSEIHRFAESQRWSATILDGAFGARAIFQKLEPGAVDSEGSPGVSS
jgi:hypothetical protein